MARPRRLVGGRPTDAEFPREKIDVEPPAGDILPQTSERWVEGTIVIPDWDVEAHKEADRLGRELREFSERLTDETGVKLPGALLMRTRPHGEGFNPREGGASRRYTKRATKRWSM